METRITGGENWIRMECISETGRRITGGSAHQGVMHLNGAQIRCLKIGGVGTSPEHRRTGMVRSFFREMDDYAREQGCMVSLLHPFSFSYYRKFGYERVADHRILEFPMSALNFVPFFRDMIPCTDESRNADLLKIYNEFAAGRNIMLRRSGEWKFPLCGEDKYTYIWYDGNGKPSAYIICRTESEFSVNRMKSVNLHVYELCFVSPEGLRKLFGFLRMFEGEMESVKIHNCAMSPEVERMLRHYTHTRITVVPDTMARINEPEGVLRTVKYPQTPGSFTVRVLREDGCPEYAAGAWKVDYAGGRAEVSRLDARAECEVTCGIGAFTQMIFGYEAYGAEEAAYIPGVELTGDCEGFFRAFGNRPCGLFEHF